MILIIIIFFIIIYSYNNKENFVDDIPITFDTLKENIYNIYKKDVNVMKNLSKISEQIQSGLTINNINTKGNINLFQYDNNNYLSFTKNQNIWSISTPQNNNDLLFLSSTQEVMRLKSDGSGIIIPQSLSIGTNTSTSTLNVDGSLEVLDDTILNTLTANSLTVNNTLNINGITNIKNDLKINNNLTTGPITCNNIIMEGNLKLGPSPSTDITLNVSGSLKVSDNIMIGGTLIINGTDFNTIYNQIVKLKTALQTNTIWYRSDLR
jgi:hypothetical protein